MTRELIIRNFLKDLGTRLGAGVVVVGIFFGLGYIKRTDYLGSSNFLGSQPVFFTTAFLLIVLFSALWIMFQRSRG